MTDLVLERFWDKVQVDPITRCWNWISSKFYNGYGSFSYQCKKIKAHRFSYQVNKGIIPNGLTVDHLCRNRSCVNPDHMELVTIQVNIHRGNNKASINAKKTHCINGHEFAGDNLRIIEGRRICRKCELQRGRAYKKRQKDKNNANF